MMQITKMLTTMLQRLKLPLCVLLCLAVSGCFGELSGSVTEDFFLQNGDGTYTYGEITVPENFKDESCPLVVISHGIYGGMNSGGAKLLAENLSEKGIVSVRVDFNRCRSNDPEAALARDKSGRTNEYTLSDMLESNELAIDFAIDNYNADKERIGIYGRSFGGRVSMIMANEGTGDIDYKAMALIAPAGNEYALIHYVGGYDKWNAMRDEAVSSGFCERNGLRFTKEWFDDYYELNPSLTGYKFEKKPVLLYYNTKDTVVEPETSLECAHAYSNVEIHKVTTDDGHGYEMSYKHSKLKNDIMKRVTDFFAENL